AARLEMIVRAEERRSQRRGPVVLDRGMGFPDGRELDAALAASARSDLRRGARAGKHAVQCPCGGKVAAVIPIERTVGAVQPAISAVARCALRVGPFEPELVAGIPRQIDHEAGSYREPPGIGGCDPPLASRDGLQ